MAETLFVDRGLPSFSDVGRPDPGSSAYVLSGFYTEKLAVSAVQFGTTLHDLSESGYTNTIATLWYGIGAFLIDRNPTWFAWDSDVSTAHFGSDDYVCRITGHVTGHFNVQCTTTDKDITDILRTLVSTIRIVPPRVVPKNALHVLTRNMHGFEIEVASEDAGVPLVSDNYTEGVIKEFDKAVKTIQSETPHGRLVIVDGPPGSGKSWLIRGLINAATRGRYIHCSADLVKQIDGPQLVKLFLDNPTNNHVWDDELGEYVEASSAPKVLLIEDGDACLVKRSSENLSAIQSILNYADGILGEAMNFRIVVTTNAEHLVEDDGGNIDEAILRPGRLAARIQVLKHPLDFANKVLRRLTGNEALTMTASTYKTDKYSLAEIYEYAYENGLGD